MHRCIGDHGVAGGGVAGLVMVENNRANGVVQIMRNWGRVGVKWKTLLDNGHAMNHHVVSRHRTDNM